MAPWLRRNKIPPEARDRLQLVVAHAAERVLTEHIGSALELVEEGAGHVPVHNLLSAYGRLHFLSDGEERKLREGVLAALGRNGNAAGPLKGPSSPISLLLRRLRGRVNPELRKWVSRHAARVEMSTAELHVEGALAAVSVLDDHATAEEAIAAYTELQNLRPTIAELVRLRTLMVLYDREHAQVEELARTHTIPYPLQRAENDG